jgi:hypothetical protein
MPLMELIAWTHTCMQPYMAISQLSVAKKIHKNIALPYSQTVKHGKQVKLFTTHVQHMITDMRVQLNMAYCLKQKQNNSDTLLQAVAPRHLSHTHVPTYEVYAVIKCNSQNVLYTNLCTSFANHST